MKHKRRDDDGGSDAAAAEAKAAKKQRRADEAAAAAAASPARCPSPARALPPHRLVLAPMVGASELAFRLLARKYGAELCYSPMCYSARFVTDAAYRSAELRSAPGDAPLVMHFCGNEPAVLLAAARLAAPHCAAIDLNLGCPQRVAHNGNFGAHLCATEAGRATALRCIRALATGGLPVPVFAKIRLLDDLSDTLAFAAQLREAGVALLAVHARYRGSATRRRDGAAHLDAVRAIRDALPDLPLLSNGNVRDAADVLAALRATGADGVMSAEGALDDPALFARASLLARKQRKRLKKRLKKAAEEEQEALREALDAAPRLPPPQGGVDDVAAPPGRCALALEYLQLAAAHSGGPSDVAVARFHVRRMCRDALAACALAPQLDAASDLAHIAAVARRCAAHEAGEAPAPADEAALAALGAAATCAKRNALRRAEFAARMTRKAKREGKALDFYATQGATPPSDADVAALRGLPGPQRMAWWNERFAQHCLALHADGRCARAEGDLGCAYLHMPPTAAAAVEALVAAPTWLLEKEV